MNLGQLEDLVEYVHCVVFLPVGALLKPAKQSSGPTVKAFVHGPVHTK
jgi:hypothetical protein